MTRSPAQVFVQRHFWALAVALGAALAVGTGIASFNLFKTQIYNSFEDTTSYITAQSLTFDSYNSASATKSLLRAIENAGQLARDIQDDGTVTEASLVQYVSDLRLTAAIVMTPAGGLVCEHASDGVGYAELKSTLCDAPALDVVKHPQKLYTARVQRDDGSIVDIACAARLDAPGVVVSAYHTSEVFADRYTLTLQSLLSDYRASDNGTVVVEDRGRAVASNTSKKSSGEIELAPADAQVVDAIKDRGETGKLLFVRTDSGLFFGMHSKARDFYVYNFEPAGRFFHYVGVTVTAVLTAYVLCISAFTFTRRMSERRRMADLLDQERRYAERLSASARAAESANRAKTEFLQRMSHDIRTPINGIRGMVEVGDANAEDLAKQTECRSKIWVASGLLLDLVNEALDMSKLESGEIILDMNTIDITELGREVCAMVERQAADADITVTCDQDDIEHPYVVASPLHVKRMLVNLVSNAAKYNRPGGYVRYRCRETGCADGRVSFEITIADNGIGMGEEFQKHIFEPFTRENQGSKRRASGTGLGTVIAKQLAELMGGSISFESKLGEGTTFTLVLPLEVATEAPDRGSERELEPEAQLKGLRVLVAEDNELNSEIARFVLERAQAGVTLVTCGEDAVKTFEASEPGAFDVVLMDIMMPGIDGYEATRRIRALERPDAATVPIVAMSANAFADDRARSREAGMNEHLAKPLDSAELVSALKRIVG